MKIYFLLTTILLVLVSNVLAEDTNDTISTVPTCTQDQCDPGCITCSDSNCHNPGFSCTEDLSLEGITPSKIKIGERQLNVEVINSGNVDLKDVYAEISGDGIKMIDNTPIDLLISKDRDYTFVNINAEKAGDIDIVVKLYTNGNLIKKEIEQITVTASEVEENKTELFNKTELANQLNKIKEEYKKAESDYQSKKTEGYPVDIVSDDIKEVDKLIRDAQFYLLDGDLKKTDVNLKIAQDNLKSIEEELSGLKKVEETLFEKIKDNLFYISSIAAAFISILTAYKLTSHHINKEKLVELHQKIKTTGSKFLPINKKEEKEETKKKSKSKKKETKTETPVEEKKEPTS